jgi:AbrB family looped-hinge helix DNA binding protein
MKISERGQITIPKAIRDKFGMHKDVELEIVATDSGVLLRKGRRGEHPVDKVMGVLKQPFDTNSYIEKIRGR